MWILLWELIVTLILTITTKVTAKNYTTSTIFKKEQIIFASDFNITKVLVPADGIKYVHTESTDIPTVFFTVVDPKSDTETCIYVLEGLAAYEVLDGGRDTTADYSFDRTVYFGAKDGLYKYVPASLSAKKYGPFNDNIIQLQKVNGSDAFYVLTKDNKLYIIENNGTARSNVPAVACATEFVLDTSNNVYFVSCNDHVINILKVGDIRAVTVTEEFNDVKLLRAAFMMDRCVPLFLDGILHLLHVNGTLEKKDFQINDRPSALSVDAALYIVAAYNGNIYEFNVMDALLHSMYGLPTRWSKDMTEIITSLIESTGGSIFDFYKWINH